MKEIYTSYLNNRTDWNALGITTIRVCVWIHDGQEARYEVEGRYLYPPIDLVNRIRNEAISWKQYVAEYTSRVLDNQDPHELVESLPEKIVFLCHEKDDTFCHRRLIGEWIEGSTGIRVQEWKGEEQMKQGVLVDSLFDF